MATFKHIVPGNNYKWTNTEGEMNMRSIRASVAILFLTAATCTILIGAVSNRHQNVYQEAMVNAEDTDSAHGIIAKEGTLPGAIYCEYGDGDDVYYIRYNSRKNISFYNMAVGSSSVAATPIGPKNYIHVLCKMGDYLAWEEDGSSLNDPEKPHSVNDWVIYLMKNNMVVKVDEGKPVKIDTITDISLPPQKLSMYGDLLVYKTYDNIPGTKDSGVVIKLFDMKKEKSKAIFSLMNIKNAVVSDPYIYKDYIVWSVLECRDGDARVIEKGYMYLYNVNTGSYARIKNGEGFINPMIWQDYVVCTNTQDIGNSLSVLDIKTGLKKDVASNILDYSVSDGYVTWNSRGADLVCVYDIVNHKTYELKRSNPSEEAGNSLLNVKIFDRTIFYLDHVFDKKSGRTLSEASRYITLKP